MIKLIITDSGPLISLAQANALDLLLEFASEVEVVITDLVYYETTSSRDVYSDAEKIFQFISKNAGHVIIQNTNYGQLVMNSIKLDPNFRIPDDAGEMSVISFDLSRSEASVIIFEDRWFIDRFERLNANTHLVSTSAFLKVALLKEIISQSRYNEIINSMSSAKRNLEAVETDTEWKSSFGN